MAGFFSFHDLVTTTLIKMMYLLGMLGISFSGLIAMGLGIFGLIQQSQGAELSPFVGVPISTFLVGFAVLVFGNLLWRLLCEAWILIFSMHEMLASLEKHFVGAPAQPSAAYQRMVT